ncbi:putative disease resistance RPP13-like protein 1 isoform X1 [Zingiber officinale]|uniref:putative disease resistance RPP13-like protein 1 isoform X1 n=1 Tax=Zingiber officinale TaxID=94328 RepID=UPI001C4CB40F|nr:putative disease resistance RPP13-like protein 1 isoform X1 [Zingiber officinale]XP_042403013.1 putative disease resistance RPP13-like protein 1 isoform X1 [Zingiber officinale]
MRTLFIRVLDDVSITSQDTTFGVLDDLFQKLKYIRALHLSQICITRLPDSLGNIKLLRYLSIKDHEIQSLPEFVCSLYNLQTLDLTDTNISVLPSQIGNLINLRHLLVPLPRSVLLPRQFRNLINPHPHYLSLPSQLAFLPPGIGKLTNLQTLTHFNVSDEKEHCDIGELNSLMKLGGHILIYLSTHEDRFSNSKPPLKTKKFLDSLDLHWGKDGFDSLTDRNQAEWQLKYLEPHVNLKTLKITHYPGVRFVGWVGASSFTKLTHLVLQNCCYKCNKLPPLGQLPSLEELVISSMNGIRHVGREFCSMLMASPSSSQNKIAFPSLKRLVFDSMENWESWDGVEIGDFPVLHFIEISKCSKLIKFPLMYYVKEMRIRGCGALDVPILHSVTNLHIDVRTQEREWMSKCHFPTLRHLTLNSKVQIVHLSQKRLPSLKILKIGSSIELWVVMGLKNLTSLNSLIIEDCPNLKFKKLPATLQQQQVKLDRCPLFEKEFKEQQHMPILGEEEEEEEELKLLELRLGNYGEEKGEGIKASGVTTLE